MMSAASLIAHIKHATSWSQFAGYQVAFTSCCLMRSLANSLMYSVRRLACRQAIVSGGSVDATVFVTQLSRLVVHFRLKSVV